MWCARLLKENGVVAMDDYMHRTRQYTELLYLSPGVAINRFFRKTKWVRESFTPVYVSWGIAFQCKKSVEKEPTAKEVSTLQKFRERTSKQQARLESWTLQDRKANDAFWTNSIK